MGPYPAPGGVADNTATVSGPVAAGPGFRGVTAAGLRMATLEQALAPTLARADGGCVVLNAESRVLLSNSVEYIVGDVLPADAALELTGIDRFGWSIGRG